MYAISAHLHRVGDAEDDQIERVVRSTLRDLATPVDGLEHVYVERGPHGVDVVMFLLAESVRAAYESGSRLVARIRTVGLAGYEVERCRVHFVPAPDGAGGSDRQPEAGPR